MSGQTVAVRVEKPAVGGRMIGRVDGRVVLVSGAIPGERVAARIERVSRGVAYAAAVSIDEPSADRREPTTDPACGGCLYAHIAYPRQLTLKAEVVRDAFSRIGRIALGSVPIAPSPEEGYRMRARLHMKGGAIGFYREGSHQLCSARRTRQLLPSTCDALDDVAVAVTDAGLSENLELEVAENIDASERVVHIDPVTPGEAARLGQIRSVDGLSGMTAGTTTRGDPHVTDVIAIEGSQVTLSRHVRTFFQGNRFLLTALVHHVISQVPRGVQVIDLYAGAGLFAISVARTHGSRVTAVEGDAFAAADLAQNVRRSGASVDAVRAPVERFRVEGQAAPGAVIVDPPRTGLSPEALHRVLDLRPRRVVYVSCDVATQARDARRLLDEGYELARVDGFDLFPNTPHVETVAVFDHP